MRFIKKIMSSLIAPTVLNPAAVVTFPAAFIRSDLSGPGPLSVLKNLGRFILDTIDTQTTVANPVSPVKQRPVDGQLPAMPLVKASTAIMETNPGCLKGKCVLCVGGQLQMYPAYRQIVEDAGGRFLSFHGAADAAMAELHTLLADADLIVCPLDCVRHEAFFVTKDYCKRARKPCVMLDKSRITTFYNGIRMLRTFVAEQMAPSNRSA
ncbi:MAG: DUF2325 domain-containing protein [Nitrosomonas sp.]|nr:DUF2325 domain-containing protein [Nitrosomonas sp.]